MVKSMENHEGKSQAIETERIEQLRLILENEQCRPITYDEALEVGESLVNFFEVLADSTLSANELTPPLFLASQA